MARIQFGSIVTGISGKLGGHIFGNSSGGPTIRTKNRVAQNFGNAPQNGISSIQNARVNVSQISQTWKDLTDNERAAWASYSIQYYTTLSLYGAHTLSAYSCFSKINHNILLVGGNIITIPVPKATLTVIDQIGMLALTAADIRMEYSGALQPGEYFIVSATGTNNVTLKPQKKGFKFIRSFDSGAASPLDFTAAYINLKGAPLVGGWITFKIEIMNINTGQRGNARSIAWQVS